MISYIPIEPLVDPIVYYATLTRFELDKKAADIDFEMEYLGNFFTQNHISKWGWRLIGPYKTLHAEFLCTPRVRKLVEKMGYGIVEYGDDGLSRHAAG